MLPQTLQTFCERLIKPEYITYRRSKEELIYKLEHSLISRDVLHIPIQERLIVLSWYIKEKYGLSINFEYDDDVLRCILGYDSIKIPLINAVRGIEGVLRYWFEADFNNVLTSLPSLPSSFLEDHERSSNRINNISLIHIVIDRLPIVKRPSGYNKTRLFI